eukprot:gene15381-biopygen7928
MPSRAAVPFTGHPWRTAKGRAARPRFSRRRGRRKWNVNAEHVWVTRMFGDPNICVTQTPTLRSANASDRGGRRSGDRGFAWRRWRSSRATTATGQLGTFAENAGGATALVIPGTFRAPLRCTAQVWGGDCEGAGQRRCGDGEGTERRRRRARSLWAMEPHKRFGAATMRKQRSDDGEGAARRVRREHLRRHRLFRGRRRRQRNPNTERPHTR